MLHILGYATNLLLPLVWAEVANHVTEEERARYTGPVVRLVGRTFAFDSCGIRDICDALRTELGDTLLTSCVVEALRTFLHTGDGATKDQSLGAARAYWLKHRASEGYIPFVLYGCGGYHRYFVLQSGEVVFSASHGPEVDRDIPEGVALRDRLRTFGIATKW